MSARAAGGISTDAPYTTMVHRPGCSTDFDTYRRRGQWPRVGIGDAPFDREPCAEGISDTLEVGRSAGPVQALV